MDVRVQIPLDGALVPSNHLSLAVYVGVRPDILVAQEDFLVPVVSVIPFDGEVESLQIAKNTNGGLSAPLNSHSHTRQKTVWS